MANFLLNALRTVAGIIPASGPTQSIGTSEGAQLACELDGKWYARAKAGQLFIGSNVQAGTVIPVGGGATPKTIVLANPVGSSFNIQVASIAIGLITATAVVGNIGLIAQSPYTTPTGTAAVGGITAALIGSASLTAADPNNCFYSAFKFVGTPTWIGTLGASFGTTTASAGPQTIWNFQDGMLNLAPGAAIGLAGNAAQTALMDATIVYAKVPTT